MRGLSPAALLATPMTILSAAPASAADREFGCAGAEVEFDVEKDDGPTPPAATSSGCV